MEIGGNQALDDAHTQPMAARRIEVLGNCLAIVPDFDGGFAVVLVRADRDGAAVPSRKAMFYRVGHQLVDEKRKDGGLLRGDSDIASRDIECDSESGGRKSPISLVGGMAGDNVDGGSSQPSLVAEQVVNGRDGLDATNRFTQVRCPWGAFIMTKLNREERGDGLQVIPHA